MSDTNHELHATILSAALASVLEPSEGVIVHHEGNGYFVFLVHDPVDNSYNVVVNTDDAFLEVPNFERVMLDDNPNLIPDKEPKETLQ